MRFELTTPTLARLCSTPELRPRSVCGPRVMGKARERLDMTEEPGFRKAGRARLSSG